jgi:DNA-binding response OmpR family regulator
MGFHTLRLQSEPTSCMKSLRDSSAAPNRVLVVDGDPKGGALIAQALQRRGFDVANAASSDAALKSVSNVSPSAIVVVLEAAAAGSLLPLLRQLASEDETQKIPVLVARCDDESVMGQAQRFGNVVVVLGDCSPETLATEVDRVLLQSAGPAASARLGFPLTCPSCRELAGMPRSVSTTANRGTYIHLVCGKCAQEWRVFREADTPGFSGP